VRIGELSLRTGVNAHQLRYYEAQGLLKPERSANGYREYGGEDVLTVTQIRRLLDAGLSTPDIAWLLPCATGTGPDFYPCPELLDKFRDRLEDLDAHISTLARSRRALNEYLHAAERRVAQYS
jgi:DNA-binding transcriptional MerR regulator